MWNHSRSTEAHAAAKVAVPSPAYQHSTIHQGRTRTTVVTRVTEVLALPATTTKAAEVEVVAMALSLLELLGKANLQARAAAEAEAAATAEVEAEAEAEAAATAEAAAQAALAVPRIWSAAAEVSAAVRVAAAVEVEVVVAVAVPVRLAASAPAVEVEAVEAAAEAEVTVKPSQSLCYKKMTSRRLQHLRQGQRLPQRSMPRLLLELLQQQVKSTQLVDRRGARVGVGISVQRVEEMEGICVSLASAVAAAAAVAVGSAAVGAQTITIPAAKKVDAAAAGAAAGGVQVARRSEGNTQRRATTTMVEAMGRTPETSSASLRWAWTAPARAPNPARAPKFQERSPPSRGRPSTLHRPWPRAALAPEMAQLHRRSRLPGTVQRNPAHPRPSTLAAPIGRIQRAIS
mmetsp:Transcript_33572/g.72751  ORF Transcript_33572/g.72751 Transcript_33572/m.72751 type:complete len:402 (-) Transcript_33572:873-2078(-)